MIHKLEITDMQDFDPAHAKYGVILVEKHPEVEFSSSNVKQLVNTYLWYPYKLDLQLSTFVEYHKEKLAMTDTQEALHLIDQWNDGIHNDNLEPIRFSRIFKIGGINFGEIDIPKTNRSIVMRIGGVRFPYQKTIHAGRGGNVWQYLQPVIKPTHQELKDKFNLNKTQREQFIKKW